MGTIRAYLLHNLHDHSDGEFYVQLMCLGRPCPSPRISLVYGISPVFFSIMGPKHPNPPGKWGGGPMQTHETPPRTQIRPNGPQVSYSQIHPNGPRPRVSYSQIHPYGPWVSYSQIRPNGPRVTKWTHQCEMWKMCVKWSEV